MKAASGAARPARRTVKDRLEVGVIRPAGRPRRRTGVQHRQPGAHTDDRASPWSTLRASVILLRTQFTKVRAGRLFPTVVKLKQGGKVRGVVVFEVPRTARVRSVEVKVGPGFARLVRWKVAQPGHT